MKKIFLILVITFIFLSIISPVNQAAGVRPLVLNFDLKPGDSADFELQFTPGEIREIVDISLYHPRQQLSGGLTYEKGDPERHPALNWIRLEETRVRIPAGEERIVRGEIEVPYDAAGSHTAVLMIEKAESEEREENQLFDFRVRYAVRLNINIDRPGQRARAQLQDLSLKPGKEGPPLIVTRIKNISPVRFSVDGEATLRDQNRRLVERVQLFSEAQTRSGRKSISIYPGSEIKFTGEITEPLFPGEYYLQLFLQYAGGRQLIERKMVSVDNEYIDNERKEFIKVNPVEVIENIRPGAAVTKVFELANISNKPLTVNVEKIEIKPEYRHSLFSAGDFQLRGETEFTLPSRDKENLVLVYRVPRSINPGGYYGQLGITVIDNRGQLLETDQVEIAMLVGEEQQYGAQIVDLSYNQQDEEHLFSVTVNNTGSIHIVPSGTLILKDKDGEEVKRINLHLQEGKNRILPDTIENLINTVTGIQAGEYTAEIVLSQKDEELDRAVFSISAK